jgi:hypothetical protein
LFDDMQKKVDKEFDIRLAKAFDKDGWLLVSKQLKDEVIKRFKGEMYIYMSSNKFWTIKEWYSNAEWVDKNISDFIESNFKWKTWFENEIEKILNKISKDIKTETWKEIDWEWVSKIIGLVINEFNK